METLMSRGKRRERKENKKEWKEWRIKRKDKYLGKREGRVC